MDPTSTGDNISSVFTPPPSNSHHASINFGGEIFHLLPERALYWPSEEALFIADLHVGKEAAFRAAGLPIPDVFGNDLARLANLFDRLAFKRLFVLGDLLHDRTAHSPEVIRAFSNWRRINRQLDITLVRGNHDRRAGDPPMEWQITCLSEPARHGNLQLRHIPHFEDSCATLAGHLHPKHRLRHGPDQLRLPCFLQRRNTLVLPAFGDFIDHATIVREPDDAIFVVVDLDVIQIESGSA